MASQVEKLEIDERDQAITRMPDYSSSLLALVETYLVIHGFRKTVGPVDTYWGHAELGEGRSLWEAVRWQIGREKEGRG